jgi:hypothetical protein
MDVIEARETLKLQPHNQIGIDSYLVHLPGEKKKVHPRGLRDISRASTV